MMEEVSKESETTVIELTSVRVNLPDRSLTLEAAGRPVARLSLSNGSILFEAAPFASEGVPQPGESGASESAESVEDEAVAGESDPALASEKDRSVILQGRLLGRVREGRPDGQGRKTAWARFAAHEEGQEGAHVYSATFHRASATTALALPADSHLVVEGYVHPSTDPEGGRLDTISVFRLIKRAEKPEPAAG